MSIAKSLRERAQRYRAMRDRINDEQTRRSLEAYAHRLEQEAAAIDEETIRITLGKLATDRDRSSE